MIGFSSRWSWCLGLSLLALGSAWAGYFLFRHSSMGDQTAAVEGHARPAASPGVVCLGYVDVEGGTLSLAPAQPGRVSEVRVGEGQHVAAGTVLMRLEDDAARFGLEQ